METKQIDPKRSRARMFAALWARVLPCLLAAFLAESALFGDVIVLKNGREIVAASVYEDGDQVIYEGRSGSVSLPRSMVERIEQGPAPSGTTLSSSERPADDPVARELSAQIELPGSDIEGILRDGAVDEERLEALANLAYQGELERQNAVNAHLLAAAYEARQRRLGTASRLAEKALRLSRRDLNALLLASQIDIARRKYSEALDHLLFAQSMAPDSPDVLTLLGYAYYFSEGPEQAIRYWKQADAIRPDENLQERIRRAMREEQVEGDFLRAESGHFTLQWEGSEVSDSLSREILETLERHFRELEVSLNFYPYEPILVILYGSQQFADITQAPAWAGAINDGKIRIPVQGLSSMTGALSRVLKHELVHSFVYRITEGRCPTWLNEGLAQVASGETLARYGFNLARVFVASRQIPLAQLEGSFMQLDPSTAAVAYAESLAAVQMIQDRYGAYQIPPLLKALGQGESTSHALQHILRLDYDGLERELAAYLSQHYGG